MVFPPSPIIYSSSQPLSFSLSYILPAEVQHDVLQRAGVPVGQHEPVSPPPARVGRREVHELMYFVMFDDYEKKHRRAEQCHQLHDG